MKFEKLNLPLEGRTIEVEEGQLRVPADPILPFIEGDGIGPDIWAAARRVLDAAVTKANGSRPTRSKRSGITRWRSRGR